MANIEGLVGRVGFAGNSLVAKLRLTRSLAMFTAEVVTTRSLSGIRFRCCEDFPPPP